MTRQHIRAACLREVQHSIKDSMKQLIEDKIHEHGVSSLFKITDAEIRGPYDGLVIFRGLRNHTASSIKSLEGFNRALYEEAQSISQASLDIALPTFRAPGTEQWFAWNRIKPNDPVDVFFEENKGDPDFALIEVNYWDNPWFPEVLRKQMERDKRRDPDKYAHVWCGKHQQLSESRVFHNWKVEEFDTPNDARFYFGADWGYAVDPTVLIRAWVKERTLYVDQEAYAVGCEIDRTPALFSKVEGASAWPIRADSARPETISYMQRHGFPKIEGAKKGPDSVKDGIEFLKSYDIIVHPRCKNTVDELSYYAWKTDPHTGEILPILSDKKNHVIDALRYAVEGLRNKHTMVISSGARF